MFRSEYADAPPLDLPLHDAVMYLAESAAALCEHVRHVTFVDTVPRATSGKILRRELRERL